jgi:hypothetical protein
MKEAQEENFTEFFKIILGRIVEIDGLNRNLFYFLQDNFDFSDFNVHYDPPLMLTEKEYKAFIRDLVDDFDIIEISSSARRIFIDLMRFSPDPFLRNKKRVILVLLVKNINGKTIYLIENVTAKTYINH